jgi:hypothetical protein
MTFTTIKSALRATQRFHREYGQKRSKYVCRKDWHGVGYVVECWQRGVKGYYFATLV